LDGSSNIDANVSIGTIFGIWKRKTEEGTPANDSDWLRDGKDILAGGYCVYGSATMFCIAIGGQVNAFTLDPSLGEFILTHHDIKVPKKGKIYSINEGNCAHWYEPITEYVALKKT
jgi:fructose-1,6-bisphosphatase I